MVDSSRPLRFPRRGPDRLLALRDLDAAVVADTVSTLDGMVLEHWPDGGWRLDAAVDSYREWLHALVDSAVDAGLAEWTWSR